MRFSLIIGLCVVFTACGDQMHPVSDGGHEGGVTEGGGAEAATDGNTGCDPSPSASTCGITDARGVFAAPAASGGSDTNDGTREHPVASIAHALDLAKAASKNVYVCAGSYAEHVVVGSSRDGVGIYGG